jgi:ribose transport system permease protein
MKAGAIRKSVFQSRFSLIWLLLAMVVVFSLTSDAFRTPENMLEILQSTGITAILVLGLTWIVAIGEMDISFADVAALVTMIAASLTVKSHLPIGLSLLVAFLAGSAVGVLNGFMTAYMKIPSLIGTIATGYAIPVLFLTTLAIYFVCRFLQDQTRMGQHLYALGENRQAAREAGIKEPKIVFYYFILSAVLASIAGILSTAQLGSGVSEIGGGTLTIQGFTAVFLGVMVVKAGKPNVIGTLIGVIMLTVLLNWITLLGLRTFIVWLARGSLLLVGVTIVTLSSYQRKVSRLKI